MLENRGHSAKISDEVLDAYQQHAVTVGLLGHIIDDGFMDPGIRPLVPGMQIIGRAVTVSMPSTDTSGNRRAVEAAGEGDIIVVDCGRDMRVARWGELICFDAKFKGIVGLVIDGALTGSRGVREMGFPVFCRSVSGLVGRATGADGAVNVTVQCGGVTVRPGDLILADDDGVVAVPPARAEALLAEFEKRFPAGHKDSKKRWILSGRAYASYPGLDWEQRKDLPPQTRTPASERSDAHPWGKK